jgi:ABC-2 type transport system permease protein
MKVRQISEVLTMVHLVKYFGIMRTAFVDMKAYIGEFGALLIWGPAHFILLFFIWTIIYKSPQAGSDFGYSLPAILGYSLIVTFIAESLFSYKFAWRLQDDNLNGTLTIFLCRPVNYLAFVFAETVPLSLISFGLSFPVIILLIVIMNLPIKLNVFILVGFIICLIISYTISYFCFILVGMSTFYIRYIWPVRATFMAFMQIFGGELLPIDLLPPSLSEIARILPFSLINFVPAQWLLGRINQLELLFSFIYGVFWIITLAIITNFLWKKAVTKFESAGG